MDPPSQTDLSPYTEVDAAIGSCLDEMGRLKTLLTDLRRQRNGLNPTCCLPTELLGEIFHHATHPTTVFYNAPPVKRWPRPWLLVTHVCHHWRDVAIMHHQLWTYIELYKSPNLASMFAERAASCPLEITSSLKACLMEPRMHWQHFISAFIASHAHHIASLYDLRLSPSAFSAFATPLNQGICLTSLEKLDVQLRDSDSNERLPRFPAKAVPNLKYLRYDGAPRTFLESLSCLALTSLIITWSRDQLDAGAWIKILQGLGTLEIIALYGVFQNFATPSSLPTLSRSTIADLPRLRSLVLEETGAGFTILQLLQHCAFPASARVDITISDYQPPDIISYIMSSLASVVSGNAPNNISMPPFVSCDIDTTGLNLWTVEVDVAKSLESICRPRTASDWRICFTDEVSIQPTLAAFSFCPLRTLAIDLDMPLAVGLFRELLDFPTIRELFINGRESADAFVVVHEVLWGTGGRILCPNLESLSFGNVAWMQHNDPELQIKERVFGLPQRLEKALRARKASGHPLKRLRLVGSIRLAGWDPMSLEEQRLVETVVQEGDRWGPKYICDCRACQIFMGVSLAGDADTE